MITIKTTRPVLQTDGEMLAVADLWLREYAPANMVSSGVDGEKNAELIVGVCLQRYGNLTVSGLTESAHLLGSTGKLVLIPEPKVPTADEIAIAANAKQHQQYLDSIKPQRTLERSKIGQQKLDQNKRDALALEIKNINALCASEINSFFVGSPHRGISYSETESGQQKLRDARDQFPRRATDLSAAKSALAAVREVKSRL
jgi:hypothetical protein